MRAIVAGALLVLVTFGSQARAEEGGRTVAADPALAFGDWGERVTLDLPPAALGTKPDVAMVASHRSVDSEIGAGWRLQATSVIRRRSATNGVPTTSTATADSLFQIDGMELVSVTGPGTAHYQPETYDGSRFDYNSTTNTWTRKRDGWTWTYGDSGAANATRNIVSGPFPMPACTGGKFCNTESWFLRSVVDPSNNRIDYTYLIHTTPAPFAAQYVSYPSSKDHLVSTITYGAGNAVVTFTYGPRPDPSVDLSGGMPVFRHKRLEKIRSTSGGAMYSHYELQYADEITSQPIIGDVTDCDNHSIPTAEVPKQSLLRKLHRTGDAAGVPQRVIRCNKYHHEAIEWEGGEQLGLTTIPNPFPTPFTPLESSWKLIPAELDGDGRTDVILLGYNTSGVVNPTPHQVYIATPNRPTPFVGAGGATQQSQFAQSWQTKLIGRLSTTTFTSREGHAIVDIDQDGIPELLTENGNAVLIEKASGSGVLAWSALANSLDRCDLRYGELQDVDGDRRPDVVVRAHGDDTVCPAEDHTRWIQNQGAAPWFDSATDRILSLPLELTTLPAAWTTAVQQCPGGVTPPSEFYADTDGDGLADDWTDEGYVADQARFSDVNHDGVLDVSYALYACWTPTVAHWVAHAPSVYSRIFFGTGKGAFIDSGLSAGPPLLLDPGAWGATGNTRITPGTFSTLDLDHDGRSELLQSTLPQIERGLGIAARTWSSMAPPAPGQPMEEVGFNVSDGALLVPDPSNPLVADFAGTAWDCSERTLTPAWGDFDGDGFLDLLTINGTLGNWSVLLKRSKRAFSEGRLIETDNEHGGRTRLTWGFSAQLPNSNTLLPVNLEVIQVVAGPAGTRTMTYRDGVRRGDQVMAFEEVTVAGVRGAIEVYSFVVAPYALGKQHLGVRYRENGGGIEHVTWIVHGESSGGTFFFNPARPYFNPVVRRCEVDVGFVAVDIDQLVGQCDAVAWLAPGVGQTGGPSENRVQYTAANYRMILGHDRSAETPPEKALFAKVWGVSMGSRVLPPATTTTTPPLYQQSVDAAVAAGAVIAGPGGFYWPLPSTLSGKVPDVVAQETAHQYPMAILGSPNIYAWDHAYDHPVRRLAYRYEHRDLATSSDDRRVDFAWDQPMSNGYWYRLLFETTNDGAGSRLARLERSTFHSPGFDLPKAISRCGLSSPGDCSLDQYQYNANGTLKKHTLPDTTSESWTRLAWCGEPLTHTDSASRVTAFTRDSRCLPLTIQREGATATFTYDTLHRPIRLVTDPGAGVSATTVTRSFYYDDAPTFQPNVEAREDYAYLEPRRAERRGDGQLELIYEDGLGRTTRRDRCADTGTNTRGGPIGLVGCAAGTRRYLAWNLYGTDGLRKLETAPFEDGETPTTTAYGHDGQNRPIVVLEPVHEPGQVAWRTDKILYGAGYEDRTEPTATGVTTTSRTHSTLGESLIAASVVRSTMTFDRLGLVTKIAEADGTATRFAYDSRYRLANELRVDANGQSIVEDCLMDDGTTMLRTYIHIIQARDGRDRVTQEILPDGTIAAYTYDTSDRILTRRVNGTLVRSYAYTAPTLSAKGQVRVTDELGGMASTSQFDGLGRTWNRAAARVNDRWTYDNTGRARTKTDVDNLVTQYFYDVQDDLTSVVHPRTGTTTYNRDGSGRLSSIVDADGATESFSYTYSGAPYRRYRGSWLFAERDYDPLGQVVYSVDRNVASDMTYDTLGRLTKLREGVISSTSALRVTDFDYDAGDRVISIARWPVIASQTATTEIHHDGWGRPYEIVDANNRTISREFDAAGRIRRVTDQEGATLETRYDTLGRVTDRQRPGAGWEHTRYFGRQTYDGESNLWRIESYDDEASTQSEKFQRYVDGTGHTLAELRPDGSTVKSIWNTGRVTRQEIRSGAAVYRATDVHYDANGRLDSETHGPYVVNHQYTAAGRLWRTITPDDTLERTYIHGELDIETQAGVQRRLQRDSWAGVVIGIDVQRGTDAIRSTEILRDALGRPTSITTDDQTHPTIVQSYSSYDYYNNPAIEENTVGAANVRQTWIYDRKGRPLSRHTSGAGLPGKQTIWGWFANDVLAAVETPTNKQIFYNYGATFDYQLDSVTLDGAVVAQVSSRDQRGAITSLTLPTVQQTRTYAYDNLGRTSSRTSGPLAPAAADFQWSATFHPDGKLHTETIDDIAHADGWTNEYTYDSAGRLTLEHAGKTDAIYGYLLDAAGNRTTTKLTAATGTQSTPMNAVYDGPKLVSVNAIGLAYNAWNEVSQDHHGNTYDRTSDGALLSITQNGATTGFARDAQGLPVAAVEAAGTRRTAWNLSAGLPLEVEESDGTVLTYLNVEGIHVGTAENGVLTGVTTDGRATELKHGSEVFGGATAFGSGTAAPTGSDERFMFAMLERVPSAREVMLARHRTYDPMTGRFLEPDPIGAAGGVELYQYGNGDPVNFIDPMGTTAIGDSCAVPGAPPVLQFDPLKPQIYQLLAPPATSSTFEMIAADGGYQAGYFRGMAQSLSWVGDIFDGPHGPYSKGPLCVVNCEESPGANPAEAPADSDQVAIYDRDEPIVVIGDGGGRGGGGGGGGVGGFFKKLFGGRNGSPTKSSHQDVHAGLVEEFMQEADRRHGLLRDAMSEELERREVVVALALDEAIALGPKQLATNAFTHLMQPPAKTAVEALRGLGTVATNYLSAPARMPELVEKIWTVENTEQAAAAAVELFDIGTDTTTGALTGTSFFLGGAALAEAGGGLLAAEGLVVAEGEAGAVAVGIGSTATTTVDDAAAAITATVGKPPRAFKWNRSLWKLRFGKDMEVALVATVKFASKTKESLAGMRFPVPLRTKLGNQRYTVLDDGVLTTPKNAIPDGPGQLNIAEMKMPGGKLTVPQAIWKGWAGLMLMNKTAPPAITYSVWRVPYIVE